MKGTLKLRTASLAAAAVMAAGLFAALPAAAETSTPETAQEDSGVPYDVANGLENSFRYKDGVPIYDDSVPAIEWEDIVQQDAATYSSNGLPPAALLITALMSASIRAPLTGTPLKIPALILS